MDTSKFTAYHGWVMDRETFIRKVGGFKNHLSNAEIELAIEDGGSMEELFRNQNLPVPNRSFYIPEDGADWILDGENILTRGHSYVAFDDDDFKEDYEYILRRAEIFHLFRHVAWATSEVAG